MTSINHTGKDSAPGQAYEFTYDNKVRLLSAALTGEAGVEEHDLNTEEFLFRSALSGILADGELVIPSSDLSLDWGAGSSGIDLGYACKVKKITPKPTGTVSRLTERHLQVPASLYNQKGGFKDQNFSMETNGDGTITLTLSEGVFTRYLKIHCHINPLDTDGWPVRAASPFVVDPVCIQEEPASGEDDR